jgi:hypothetical protein
MHWDTCRIAAANYAVIGFLLFTGLSRLEAQVGPYTPPGSGMWYSAGFGYASICRNGCLSAANVEIGAGVVSSPKLHLGAVLAGLSKASEYYRTTLARAELRARYYPDLTGGFYLTGGLGLGMIRLSPGPESFGRSLTQFGPAFLAGLGYDIQVSPRASVTLSADGSGVRGRGEDRLSLDVWKLGLGVLLH